MAALSTFAGLFVLYAIARHQADMQLRDFCLFKVLGARGPSLRKLTTIQYSVLGSFSALVGVGLGTVTAFVLSIFVFERATGLVWLEPVGIMILITGLTTLTGQLAARKVFAAKPMALLNS
jgi:predicted lysophospholipase L1 biosynthesis ABC-type transport system permease subunit